MQSKSGLKRMVLAKQSEMTFIELKKQYLRKCQVNNLSEYTLNFYEVSCRMFNKFCDLSVLKVGDINRDLIDDYILHLKDTSVKDTTINTYIHGISPIIKYGMSLGIVAKFGFKEIRTTEEIKQVYTREELAVLLERPDRGSFAEYRNWVIINFLLGTGVRALELRSIRIKDIDLQAGMLIVSRTKNRRQRYIPISKSLSKILGEFMEYRNVEKQEDYLFCNEFGQYLPRTTLQGAVTKYCLKRGVNKYSLHLFRHTFAKMWILNQGDIFSLQKILGHSSLKQVNHYANIYSEDIKRNFDNYCALEQVQGINKERIILKK